MRLKLTVLILAISAFVSCVSDRPLVKESPPQGKELAEELPKGPSGQSAGDGVPIILVHGYSGWGREDVPGFYYWGGFTDLEAELRAAGYRVHTAAIGPFSSNWDRACELYAFIKGGTVDYGENHSEVFKHERFGPTYPGVYPEWDENHPVHLIAHSMGGLTSRMLARLLRHGDRQEREVSGGACHPLFRESEQWVRSITTLSTPHSGTTLINDINIIDTFFKAAIVALATVAESNLFPDFDLKMAQWGITRKPGEPLARYFSRLRNHEIWTRTERDFSLWELSVEGAAAFNKGTPAEPDIFYFAWANEQTTIDPLRRHQIPEISMLSIFAPGGVFMGSYIERGVYTTDESWWQNDGVVNTISMKGPVLESQDTIIEYAGNLRPGVWNYMGVMASMDHGDVIGIPSAKLITPEGFDSLVGFYLYVCGLISSALESP